MQFSDFGLKVNASKRLHPLSDPEDIISEEILSPEGIQAAIVYLAREIADRCVGDNVAFIGIYTRGVTFARRVAAVLKLQGLDYPVGTLDISLYRDDFDNRGTDLPRLESSEVPFALDGTRVIIFDEVIFTGRTIRAALDGLMDYGRPAKVELAVLIDRGHREIPVQPDYVGKTIKTSRDQYIKVRFQEDDESEGVFILQKRASEPPSSA